MKTLCLAPGYFGAGSGNADGFGGGLRDGLELEPGGEVLVSHLAVGHNYLTLFHYFRPMLAQQPEGAQGRMFPQQATAQNDEVPEGDGQEIPQVQMGRHVLDAHQEAVFHRVHVDGIR